MEYSMKLAEAKEKINKTFENESRNRLIREGMNDKKIEKRLKSLAEEKNYEM